MVRSPSAAARLAIFDASLCGEAAGATGTGRAAGAAGAGVAGAVETGCEVEFVGIGSPLLTVILSSPTSN